MTQKSLSEMDQNFERKEFGGRELEFHDIPSGPMALDGFAWYENEKTFCRLPQDVLPKINSSAAFLATHTAGGAVRFRTDAQTIAISAQLDSSEDMSHMPRTGSGGFDLYLGLGTDKKFVRSSFHEPTKATVEWLFDATKEMRDCTIYFPLYRGVASARVALTPGCQLLPPAPLTVKEPLVFYGSSITQGGCACRPGNAYTAMVARRLDANHINLGFSGSAQAEPALAERLATLNMSVFIMDYDHNAPDPDFLRKTHQPFFQILRQAQPKLPVVFVSKPDFKESIPADGERREIIRATYQAAKAAGDKNGYFVDGETLFGDDSRDACTVDGCHPNDLGFYRMACAITPVVREALKNRV
jgi:lysophospholipase L1-like esterase